MVESKAALETKKRRREVEVGPDSAGFFHPDSARFRIFPWISLIWGQHQEIFDARCGCFIHPGFHQTLRQNVWHSVMGCAKRNIEGTPGFPQQLEAKTSLEYDQTGWFGQILEYQIFRQSRNSTEGDIPPPNFQFQILTAICSSQRSSSQLYPGVLLDLQWIPSGKLT